MYQQCNWYRVLEKPLRIVVPRCRLSEFSPATLKNGKNWQMMCWTRLRPNSCGAARALSNKPGQSLPLLNSPERQSDKVGCRSSVVLVYVTNTSQASKKGVHPWDSSVKVPEMFSTIKGVQRYTVNLRNNSQAFFKRSKFRRTESSLYSEYECKERRRYVCIFLSFLKLSSTTNICHQHLARAKFCLTDNMFAKPWRILRLKTWETVFKWCPLTPYTKHLRFLFWCPSSELCVRY